MKVRWNSAIDEILGHEKPLGVTGARLRDVRTGALSTIDADGVFVAIGHAPASELVRRPARAEAATATCETKPGSTATSVEGVFAAGDVADDVFRQAVTAAGSRLHGGAGGGALARPPGSGARRSRVKRAQNLL